MNFDKIIDSYKDDIVKNVQRLVRIPSVEAPRDGNMPFGKDVQKALDEALALCDQLGFNTLNVDNYAGHADFGNHKETLGILAHLDVVPAGDNWSKDPFGGEIHDNKIYGRGTIDDKGPCVAALFAMKAVKDSGVTLKKNVRMIFGTNEETNWEGIMYYLNHHKAPELAFTPDADFPVIHGEKGIVDIEVKHTFSDIVHDGGLRILSFKGGNAINMVPDKAEVRLIETYPIEAIVAKFNEAHNTSISYEKKDDVTILTAQGKSAHGSTPHLGVNAISHLLWLLDVLDIEIGDQSDFIRFFRKHIGMDYNGQNMGCAFEDKDSGKLTLNIGLIDIDEEKASISFNIRYPINRKVDDVTKGIIDTIGSHNYEVIPSGHLDPIYFEKDHPMITTLNDIYQSYTSDVREPLTIGGGTYARAMKNAVAFGPMFPGDPDVAHQLDEYIDIDKLILVTKMYAKAIYELAKD